LRSDWLNTDKRPVSLHPTGEFSDLAGLLSANPARPASNQVIKCAGKGPL